MILDGRISVDGVVLKSPVCLLEDLSGVRVDGRAIAPEAPSQIWLFHKPVGCLTARFDPKGANADTQEEGAKKARPTIYDHLPEDLHKLMPVGRLDYKTEGLLLLTNDGDIKRRLELPSQGWSRCYRVRGRGTLKPRMLTALRKGLCIDGIEYAPMKVSVTKESGRTIWFEMTLVEGKNREIRKLLRHFGIEVARLIRTSYGPWRLGELAPGAVIPLDRDELKKLYESPV